MQYARLWSKYFLFLYWLHKETFTQNTNDLRIVLSLMDWFELSCDWLYVQGRRRWGRGAGGGACARVSVNPIWTKGGRLRPPSFWTMRRYWCKYIAVYVLENICWWQFWLAFSNWKYSLCYSVFFILLLYLKCVQKKVDWQIAVLQLFQARFPPSNVCFIKILSKLSSVLLLGLLRIFMKQTLHEYLSHNWSSDGHFEVLNGSVS